MSECTAELIAKAAREVAADLGCIGTVEQDRIATAFEKLADLIDPPRREEICGYGSCELPEGGCPACQGL